MQASRALRYARRRAGLTQRDLAGRSGVPQSAIARIETGRSVPRTDTLTRLLDACGFTLQLVPAPDVDLTAIREMLRLTTTERLELAVAEAHNLERLGL